MSALCAAPACGAIREDAGKIRAPKVVGVPPADAVFGLCSMPDGQIRHYNYGGQPENGVGKSIYIVSNRMYIYSEDGAITWKERQAPAGMEFGCFFSPHWGRYFNFLNMDGSAWFLDCGADGICAGKSQICPWPLELNTEPLVFGERIILPITLRISSAQDLDFGFGVVFLISDDFGRTWRKSNRLNVPHHKSGGLHKGIRWNHDAMEASAVRLKNGDLWALIRTSQDNLWQSRSKDGGLTWSAPEATDFYGTCVMPKIKRLSDGRLLLMWSNSTPLAEAEGADGVWEDVFTNRSAIHAALSDDDGKSCSTSAAMLKTLRLFPEWTKACTSRNFWIWAMGRFWRP